MADFGKLNFAVAFNPQTAFPLDARYLFNSLAEAQEAAKTAVEVGSSNGTYFFGQNIVVVENQEATLYVIQPNKTLKAVGTVPVGDNKSIIINQNNQISVKGFAEATTNMQPRKNAQGEIEWFAPDTSTVEGLSATVGQHTQQIEQLEANVTDLKNNKANKSDVYTKQETDNKISAAIGATYRPAGSIAFESLPSPAKTELGKVYNITNEFTASDKFVSGEVGKKYPAGTNVVCIEESKDTYKWDVLSGFVDLSAYSTTEQIEAKYATKNEVTTGLDKKVDKVEGSSLIQNTLITKLEGMKEIKDVDTELAVDPQGVLKVVAINQGQVTGLAEALQGKVNVEPGKGLSSNDFTKELMDKLNGIQSGAQANILESVKVAGFPLQITEKAVDIVIATAQTAGVVKGSTEENKIAVNIAGDMEVNSLNVSKLTQTIGDTLTLNGGNASSNHA